MACDHLIVSLASSRPEVRSSLCITEPAALLNPFQPLSAEGKVSNTSNARANVALLLNVHRNCVALYSWEESLTNGRARHGYRVAACNPTAVTCQLHAQAALGRDTGDPTAGDEVTAALLDLYTILFQSALHDAAAGQILLRYVCPASGAAAISRHRSVFLATVCPPSHTLLAVPGMR